MFPKTISPAPWEGRVLGTKKGVPTTCQVLSKKESRESLGLINPWEGPDNYPREKLAFTIFSEATATLALAGLGMRARNRKGGKG